MESKRKLISLTLSLLLFGASGCTNDKYNDYVLDKEKVDKIIDTYNELEEKAFDKALDIKDNIVDKGTQIKENVMDAYPYYKEKIEEKLDDFSRKYLK